MNITGKQEPPATFSATKALNPQPGSDLNFSRKSTLRRTRTPSLSRLKRTGAPVGRRSRPETPLLKWKTEDKEKTAAVEDVELEGDRRGRGRSAKVVSARKLAAGLWRMQLPETVAGGGGDRSRDRLAMQSAASHVGVSFKSRQSSKAYEEEQRDAVGIPCSVSNAKKGSLHKLEPAFQFSNPLMECTTKWDPVSSETADEVRQLYGQLKRFDQQASAVSVVSALEAELEQARALIQELEAERRSSKKKLEQFLRKVGEERAAWRIREHEKIRAFIDDMKSDLSQERKSSQRFKVVNSKLVNELADTKISAKRYMQDFEKERKARELLEEICDELAKEIGEDKAEVEALKRESMKLRVEVDEERKMLQMAEVWREERVHMKLVDAKVSLEQKYSQMNELAADLETFLKSRNTTIDVKEMREAELLRQAAASINVRDIQEFTYEPSNPDDIFSGFEDVNFFEQNDREIEACAAYSPVSHASKIRTVSPEFNVVNKESIKRYSNAYNDHNDEIEEDESEWETVSHLENQGSSYSPEGSAMSVDKNHRDSNVSGSGTEWEENGCGETPIRETSEVCSMPTKQPKKVSSIARLWRSGPNYGESYKIIPVEGVNDTVSNGRKSSAGIISPDQGSGKGGLSPPDLSGHWSSPDSENPHIARELKGRIPWPRGAQKHSLKAKLLEARKQSQKFQLRHVLEQKI